MPGNNVPCLNPKLCGVKSHLPGTAARCRKGKLGANGKPTYLAAPPALGNKTKSAPTVQLSPAEEADYAKVVSGETLQLALPEGKYGTRVLLEITGRKGDLYESTDQPVTVKIVTQRGVEALSSYAGDDVRLTFWEGDTHTGWILPVDEDGKVIADQIGYDDYLEMERAGGLAWNACFAEEVNPDGSLSQEDMGREAIRRLHSEVNRKHEQLRAWNDQQKIDRLKRQQVKKNPEPKAPEKFIDFLTEKRRS